MIVASLDNKTSKKANNKGTYHLPTWSVHLLFNAIKQGLNDRPILLFIVVPAKSDSDVTFCLQ